VTELPEVRVFPSAADFRAWLEKNCESSDQLWVGYYKKGVGKRSMSYPEAVDEALCFGWIDGQIRSIDAEVYANRYSPRRPGSTWSAANIRRAGELIAAGRMQPPGRRAFEGRRADGTAQYSYENRPDDLPEEYATTFRGNAPAWKFFEAAPPAYRRSMTWWIVSARREETRARRLRAVIDASADGRRVDDMNLPKLGRR
jgi:uncharacterized protein YdeI (YjbR/CyaY-like superfamily)